MLEINDENLQKLSKKMEKFVCLKGINLSLAK